MRSTLGALLLASLTAGAAAAQITATLTGTVVDPNAAAVPGARVRLSNALTGFSREALTTTEGTFSFTNVPPQTYVLVVESSAFVEERQTLGLRSNVPVRLTVTLRLPAQSTRVNVAAYDTRVLVEPEATGTRTELNAASMEKMPVGVGARGLEGVLLSFPGFAANANGAIHPRGAHNQMTYVIDGMPVSDQLTGSFANAVDPAIVESIELHTGNIPAEFGSKVSGVAVVTTRSGLAAGRGFSGNLQTSAGSFGTLAQLAQFSGGTSRLGWFASLNGLTSNRFLDQVSFSNLHNRGDSERGFTRLDWHASPRDAVRLNLMAGRSSFQLANLPSQQASGQDQRQRLEDASASAGWLRTVDARTTLDFLGSWRAAVAQLYPSPGDTPVTAAQARHLTTLTAAARLSRVSGSHTIRAGADVQRFPVREHFSFGVTDPAFAAAHPSLHPYDLTGAGALFQFSANRSGGLYSAFFQDSIHWNRWVFSLGLRYDEYRFLVTGRQAQPRLGVSFHLKETGTVFRASYNRNYQTPPNENLLLSSSSKAAVLGGGSILIRPERQNVYELGLQQSLGRFAGLSASYYHKDSGDMQDNDNFFNTGIIFPTSLAKARVNGAEARLAVPALHGLSGSLSLTHYRAIVTPPFTGGLFLGSTAIDALSAGPFVIDHDQTLGLHGSAQYAHRRGWWASASARYDSGLVCNPSDPDAVAADPDYAPLLPYVNLDASPARVRPRTVVDLAAGYQRQREGRRRWEMSVQVNNVTNKVALYNFQSLFVGTRLVQPRSAGLRLRWYF